jgi:hypothetical protein
MIPWLYRYIFRGIGVVLLLSALTILWLAIHSQLQRSATGARPAHVPAAARHK